MNLFSKTLTLLTPKEKCCGAPAVLGMNVIVVRYAPGKVLCVHASNEPAGQVTRFDPQYLTRVCAQ